MHFTNRNTSLRTCTTTYPHLSGLQAAITLRWQLTERESTTPSTKSAYTACNTNTHSLAHIMTHCPALTHSGAQHNISSPLERWHSWLTVCFSSRGWTCSAWQAKEPQQQHLNPVVYFVNWQPSTTLLSNAIRQAGQNDKKRSDRSWNSHQDFSSHQISKLQLWKQREDASQMSS